MITSMDKKRFSIEGDRIRALYGHSQGLTVERKAELPPAVLYHGTTHAAYESVMADGLKPMSRQLVHLSEEVETAIAVGKRRDENPVLLEIDAIAAHADGIAFYRGNDAVWLCDSLPARYIKRVDL